MAYLLEVEVSGECGDVGCKRLAKCEIYNKHHKYVGVFCKLCGYRRLEGLEKIEQRDAKQAET